MYFQLRYIVIYICIVAKVFSALLLYNELFIVSRSSPYIREHMVLHTLLEVMSNATPRGMNAIPIAKKAGRTVPAVMMGCHAGSFCCLNFVSIQNQ